MDCPSEEAFLRRANGLASQAEMRAFDAHVARCSRCDELALLVSAAPSGGSGRSWQRAAVDPSPPLGDVGRYTIDRLIGCGAMGAVFSAHDPELDRRVAIKLVRACIGEEAQRRLLREARALARLRHPCVVEVHDVGVHGSEVYLVMELVDGCNLTSWRRNEDRTPREILGVFGHVVRGLAAAHDAGLVHRDVKPDNILIAKDKRVKVADFGLAFGVRRQTVPESVGLVGSQQDDLRATQGLTVTGAQVGTPRYMAPEVWEGSRGDARSDQYSFFVALYETLYRVAAFDGETIDQLRTNICAGNLRAPPAVADVPRRVAASIARGLALRPADRFASMHDVAQVLRLHPRRRELVAVGLGTGVLTGVLGWGLARGSPGSVQAACGPQAVTQKLAGIWDAPEREAVGRAIRQTQVSYAASVHRYVERSLDRFAEQWGEAYGALCRTAQREPKPLPPAIDRRMACLLAARREFATTVTTLTGVSADVVEDVHDLVDELPVPADCADAALSELDVPLPREHDRPAVDEARRLLAQAAARGRAGRFEEALMMVEAARGSAATTDYAPLQTELDNRAGFVLERMGSYADAEARLRDALRSSTKWGQWAHALVAARRLMLVVGARLGRHDEGLAFGVMARGLMERPGFGPADEAAVSTVLAGVMRYRGDLAPAEAEHRKALALFESVRGPDHPDTAYARGFLASVLHDQGKYAEAELQCRQALASFEATVGPTHPDCANSRNCLAAMLNAQGKHAEAETEQRRGLAVLERALGPLHPFGAAGRNNLATALAAQGKYAEAEVEQRRALQVYERALGPEHPTSAEARINLGAVLFQRGDYEAAQEQYQRGVAVLTDALGPTHPSLVASRSNLVAVLHARGKYDEAEAEQRTVVQLFETTLGAKHPAVAGARNNLANVLRAQGKFAEAERELRGAVALAEDALGSEHPEVALSRGNLAGVLDEQGKLQQAQEQYRMALALREKVLSPDHPKIGLSLMRLAEVIQKTRGGRAEARDLLERAWVILASADIEDETRAGCAFALARLRWADPQGRASAGELAAEAHQLFEAAGPAHMSQRRRVERWLRRRGLLERRPV